MNLSIVIPLLNEADSLPELQAWIDRVMENTGLTYEIIYVDDGSTDGSWDVISSLSRKRDNHPKSVLKGIRFQTNYGKSQALHAGFAAVNGEVVITMDADLQDSPEEIPELYALINDEKYHLVSGWKKSGTTQYYLKIYRVSYLTGLLVRQVGSICMILIVVLRLIT